MNIIEYLKENRSQLNNGLPINLIDVIDEREVYAGNFRDLVEWIDNTPGLAHVKNARFIYDDVYNGQDKIVLWYMKDIKEYDDFDISQFAAKLKRLEEYEKSLEEKPVAIEKRKDENIKFSEYGNRLVAPWTDKEAEDIKNGSWEGTQKYEEDVKTLQDAAAWCLLTYGELALDTVDEWVTSGASVAFGFKIDDLKTELEKCFVFDKEVSIEEKLTDAEERSFVSGNVKAFKKRDEVTLD